MISVALIVEKLICPEANVRPKFRFLEPDGKESLTTDEHGLSREDFDANYTNSREFELTRFLFAPISEIRVNSASVLIRVNPC